MPSAAAQTAATITVDRNGRSFRSLLINCLVSGCIRLASLPVLLLGSAIRPLVQHF